MPFLLINSRTLHFLRCLVPEENTFSWTPNLNSEYLSTIKSQRQISVFTGSFTQCTTACVGLPKFLKKWIWIHATSSQSSGRCVCLQQQCIIQQSHCHGFRCWRGRYLIFYFFYFFLICESRRSEGANIHLLHHSGLWWLFSSFPSFPSYNLAGLIQIITHERAGSLVSYSSV